MWVEGAARTGGESESSFCARFYTDGQLKKKKKKKDEFCCPDPSHRDHIAVEARPRSPQGGSRGGFPGGEGRFIIHGFCP